MIPRLASRIPGQRLSSAQLRAGDPPVLDLPCTYIANPRTDLTDLVGTAPNFLWVAGDGNTPTIGPALTATGSPGSIASPYQLEDGTELNFETYSGTQYRKKLVDTTLDPAAGEDFVVVALVSIPSVTATSYLIHGSFNGSKGWAIYSSATGQPVLYIVADTTIAATVPVSIGSLALIIGLCNRDGNSTLFLNGVAGTPLATPAGAFAGGGIGIAARPDGSLPYNGNILFTAFYKGTGLNEIWTANTNELIKKVTAAFTGILPRAGGLPTFTRATAASWKDRNGRYWLASPGLPRAGDRTTDSESGIRLAAARTNKCYRNVNPADGSTWLLDTAGMETNLLTDGDMELDNVTYWPAFMSVGTTTKETTTPHSGTRCLRLTHTTHAHVACNSALTIGKTYHITGWARGDGTAYPRITNAALTLGYFSGTVSNTWQYFQATFVADATYILFSKIHAGTSYAEYDDLFIEQAVQVVNDDAALTTAKVQCFGPNVFQFDNSAGSNDRYARQGAACGDTNKVSLSVISDLVTGSGAQIGLWDTADSTFSNGADTTDTYVRTISNNITPVATEVFCVKIPAGCKVNWIAEQNEGNGTTGGCYATSVIPNWSTSAAAVRNQETLDQVESPANQQGSVEIALTPLGWTTFPNESTGAGNYVVTRSGTLDLILYLASNSRWRTYDGTTVVELTTNNPANEVRQVLRSKWKVGTQVISVDSIAISGAYDATRAGSGTYRICNPNAEASIDSIRIFKHGT